MTEKDLKDNEFGWMNNGGGKKYCADIEARTGVEQNTQSIEALQEGMTAPYYGAGRVKGATDPSFTKTIGDRAGLLRVLSHMKIGTFDKDGVLTHECRGGRLTADVKGADVAINGDDGDVLLYCDVPVFNGHCKETFDNTEYNMLSLGLLQHNVGTKQAQRIKPFAIVPHYTVNAKLANDERSCAHSVYNTSINGTYGGSYNLFKQKIKTSGAGYPNQYISSLASSQQARNKNADPTVKDRWIGLAHNLESIWWTAMYLEMGTLDFVDAAKAGYGCTSTAADASTWANNGVSGISGIKVVDAGNDRYYPLMGYNWKDADNNTIYGTGGIESAWYSFTEMMEAQRVLDKIAAANLIGYITPAGNTEVTPTVFTAGGSAIASNVNLSTGEGMVKGQKYYTVRNMPNCQGMDDGVMTAVVNIYVALDFADGAKDPSGNDLTGLVGIYKMSHPVYRGKDMMSGMFQQLEGIHYTYYNDGVSCKQRLYVAESVDDIPVIHDNDTIYGDIGTQFNPLKGLKLVKDEFNGGGWSSDADYDAGIFAHTEWSGAGQHTKECGHVWLGACWGQGVDGQPAVGKECVCASVAGCDAVYGIAGRTLDANDAATNVSDCYAGGFALVSPQIQ